MKNLSDKQALAGEIKREILMDLNRSFGRHDGLHQRLVDSIKQEVFMELGLGHYRQKPDPNRFFIESIKNEVLGQIWGGVQLNPLASGNPVNLDRATIDSIKREIVAQIESEREAPGVDPVLVQTVKDSVMAEINATQPR
ncbi:MAG: hypothetical protein GX996_01985 [Firmicutes bacterium]|nr:hypothetical protein [Bacillota bacterium]